MPSLWCAVRNGRNQLSETMKRGGADRPKSVVKPHGLDVAHHPVTVLGQRQWRSQFSKTQIQKGQGP